MTFPRLLVVGCGSMGIAMLRRWLVAENLPLHHITILDHHPAPSNLPRSALSYTWTTTRETLEAEPLPDIILYAVKPQAMAKAIAETAHLVRPKTLLISIAAGRPIAYYREQLEHHGLPMTPFARVMPNLAARLGQGLTLAVGNFFLDHDQKKLVEVLIAPFGSHLWLPDETMMNASMCISACGPAYVFLLTHCLMAAGVRAGLPADLATTLARQMVIGCGALFQATSDSAEKMMQQIMSPGGVTVEGIKILCRDHILQNLIDEVMDKTVARSNELEQEDEKK